MREILCPVQHHSRSLHRLFQLLNQIFPYTVEAGEQTTSLMGLTPKIVSGFRVDHSEICVTHRCRFVVLRNRICSQAPVLSDSSSLPSCGNNVATFVRVRRE